MTAHLQLYPKAHLHRCRHHLSRNLQYDLHIIQAVPTQPLCNDKQAGLSILTFHSNITCQPFRRFFMTVEREKVSLPASSRKVSLGQS